MAVLKYKDPTTGKVMVVGGGSITSDSSSITISPTEPTDGSELWINPDDEEETVYTKEEVDKKLAEIPLGVTMKLLWENPSPNADFASQTVELDLSTYSGVVISYKPYKDSDDSFTVFAEKGTTSLASVWKWIKPYWRSAMVKETGIYFYNANAAKGFDNWEFVETTEHVIPLRIYGIKGVQ